MKKIRIITAVIFFLVSGCSMFFNLKSDIINTIQKECRGKNECVIKVANLTGFKWDRMVIFRWPASKQEIDRTLGFNYNEDPDLLNIMIFLYKGKIVHQEKEQIAVEKPNDLSIEYPDSVNHMIFTPPNAIFRGSTLDLDGKTYYSIKPLRSSGK